MTVYIPGPLRSYTGGANRVEAEGATLGELVADLDRRFPGIRFRMIDEQDGIRRHIKLFAGEEKAADLTARLSDVREVHIICALSGG
jgi:molybdopterin converting factor small subunit